MNKTDNYHWPTIAVTSACLALCGFCLHWQFVLYADYRSPDFIRASRGAILGTCVEAVTDDQLQSALYHTTDWSCTKDNKDHLSNLLSVSIHALYYASTQRTLSEDGTRVLDSLILTTQGSKGHTITRSQAYNALKDIGTPITDCSAIYMTENREGVPPDPMSPIVVCDSETQVNSSNTVSANMNALFTHCVRQFSYARSYPTSGTFGIPKFGIDPKPTILPIIEISHTTPWYDRTRIVVGTRWGYSCIVYVIFVLSTCFFLMDCTILILSDITKVEVYLAQSDHVSGDRRSRRKAVMTMFATFQAKRDLRCTVSAILISFEVVLWLLLIGIPWNFSFGLSRPICETGEAEHWVATFYPYTMGGWKSDYDATALELLILASHVLTAIAVPLASINRRGTRHTRRISMDSPDVIPSTNVNSGSLRSELWMKMLMTGAIVFYVGQAIVAFRFGIAWAQGVSKGEFDELSIGFMLRDHVRAIIYMSMTIGFSLGSIVGRWLLNGFSYTSFTLFLFWVLLTLCAFLPPFLVSAYWVFFSFESSQGQMDCQSTFGDSHHYWFARFACDLRAVTYIAAVILLLVAAIAPITIGLIEYSSLACTARRRVQVYLPEYVERLLEQSSP